MNCEDPQMKNILSIFVCACVYIYLCMCLYIYVHVSVFGLMVNAVEKQTYNSTYPIPKNT